MNYLIFCLRTAALLPIPLAALAQSTAYPGYLLDSSGNFVKSGTPGECWHTGEWTPALGVEPCDPSLRKAQAPLPAPPPPATTAVVPPPAAPPPVVIVPVQRKISISADTLFGFDKSTLTNEGKKVLDDVVLQLRSMEPTKIYITGHTDRIGTKAYNQKLSVKRATVVHDYLVSNGVTASTMQAKGMGEESPATLPDTCKRISGAALIACLQPDRRVEVEFEGLVKP